MALTEDLDSAPILAVPLQRNLYVPLALQARKFLSPLDQQNTVLGAQIIEGESFKLARSVDTIEIDMEEISPRPAILVHQREGGTGNIFFLGRLERGSNSFDQRGLAGPEIPAQ